MARRKNSGIHIRHDDGSTSGSKLFDAAYDALSARDEAIAAFRQAATREERALQAKQYCDAKRDFRNAVSWHSKIVRLAAKYISDNGDVANIAELIHWLQQQGVEVHADGEAGPGQTVRAVRMILHSAFGITGKRGRKRGR